MCRTLSERSQKRESKGSKQRRRYNWRHGRSS
ncbi:hypothetical protein FOMG_19087 [Fusarium oxysporum f. sp. melonis 26406]|uniref:Uncharacterized protein n=1 Tax=Fusarium oxysporum f. sp. melonis 26406 TaxID=1089452 RepID=W9Z6E6_FUSOX|nr:hypothetical protein FOMG_19087 [Fusarium oxysporum f. sp. melonis 26406]